MKRFLHLAIAITACAAPLVAQSSAPEIPYDANVDLLKFPDNIHLGEAAGVATNSKGHIFVYSRTGASHATVGTSRTFYKAGSRLFEFDQAGKFVREIGQGVYGFNFAQGVKVDPQDNIWVVDQGSSNVIKFDPEGRILLVLSRKPEAIAVRPAAGRGGPGGAPGAEGRGGPPAEGPRAGGPPPDGRGTRAPARPQPPAGGGGRGPARAPRSRIPRGTLPRPPGG